MRTPSPWRVMALAAASLGAGYLLHRFIKLSARRRVRPTARLRSKNLVMVAVLGDSLFRDVKATEHLLHSVLEPRIYPDGTEKAKITSMIVAMRDLPQQIELLVQNGEAPDAVLVWIGPNDIAFKGFKNKRGPHADVEIAGRLLAVERAYEKHLRRLAQFMRSFPGPRVIVLYAMARLHRRTHSQRGRWISYRTQRISHAFDRVIQRLARRLQREEKMLRSQIKIVSSSRLTSVFSGTPRFFHEDGLHLKPQGQQRIADALLQDFKSVILPALGAEPAPAQLLLRRSGDG